MLHYIVVIFPKQKNHKRLHIFLLTLGIVVGGIFFWHRGQHSAEAHTIPPQPAYNVVPQWPKTTDAAAIGIQGAGVIATTGDSKPRPIASIAKVITALAVLEKRPLKNIDDTGPYIPITEADEQFYRDYVAKNGTVVLIKAGIPITERDALEAMLLPSANNVADTTAIWAFGSLKKYREYANAMLKRLGLKDTTVGIDASGLDPSTKSTARDLVRLGEIGLKSPVIAQIVALPSATIPFAGPIPNYNAMVTRHGYTGLKPGESVEAGNTLLFSTNETIQGQPITIIGAILGTENYKQSNDGALQIVDSIKKTLKPTRP